MAHVIYQCLQVLSDPIGLFIDGGANGGLASADICVVEYIK